MRHRKRGRKLNRTSSHRKSLMRNLAISLVTHKRIKTTDAKAKELRGFVERLITYAKKADIHNRRLIQQKLPGKLGKNIANILIHDIAPNYKSRNGGYTRVIKLDNRKNDNAKMCLIEFVNLKVKNDNEIENKKDSEDIKSKK